MTLEELMAKLKEDTTSANDFWCEHSLDELFKCGWSGYSQTALDHTFTCMDSYGGEDQGTDYWSVWKVVSPDGKDLGFVKLYGYYYSYDGATFQGWMEVKPVEKLVTVYE